MENFGDWLNKEIKRRKWRQADLARAANLDTAVISNLVNGKRGPGEDTCTAIAKAFDLPPETVFRAAGLLPPAPEITPVMERALYYLSQLDPEDQERVMLYLEVLASRYKLTGERP